MQETEGTRSLTERIDTSKKRTMADVEKKRDRSSLLALHPTALTRFLTSPGLVAFQAAGELVVRQQERKTA